MIDHQIHRHPRVDLAGVAAQTGKRRAHRGQIDDCRYAGEVLHDHPCRLKGHVGALLGLRLPAGQRHDVRLFDFAAVYLAKNRLKQDADGKGQLLELGQTRGLQAVQPVNEITARLCR